MQNLINDQSINRNWGEDVDQMVRLRDTAKVDLARSKMRLLELGVKTTKDGVLHHLPGLNVQKYQDWNNQEFSWEAVYKDGRVIRQFEKGKQNHYGNIDQDFLKTFRWVSCFDYATDNADKRVVVELDFETGLFSFLNGFVPQEIRAEVMAGYPSLFQPKLVMLMKRRVSYSQTYPEGKPDEISEYNRYLIGWEGTAESPTKMKKLLCVEPNGFVHLWLDQ